MDSRCILALAHSCGACLLQHCMVAMPGGRGLRADQHGGSSLRVWRASGRCLSVAENRHIRPATAPTLQRGSAPNGGAARLAGWAGCWVLCRWVPSRHSSWVRTCRSSAVCRPCCLAHLQAPVPARNLHPSPMGPPLVLPPAPVWCLDGCWATTRAAGGRRGAGHRHGAHAWQRQHAALTVGAPGHKAVAAHCTPPAWRPLQWGWRCLQCAERTTTRARVTHACPVDGGKPAPSPHCQAVTHRARLPQPQTLVGC